jgi:hypothetical protein
MSTKMSGDGGDVKAKRSDALRSSAMIVPRLIARIMKKLTSELSAGEQLGQKRQKSFLPQIALIDAEMGSLHAGFKMH